MADQNSIRCIKSTEYSIHTRRCFITGEHCSQQTNIQKERQRLHEKGEINAFIVMNFSSISDVVYEARIKPFIEELKKYLFLDHKGSRIACISSGNLENIDDDQKFTYLDCRNTIANSAKQDPSAFQEILKKYTEESCHDAIDDLSLDPQKPDDLFKKLDDLFEIQIKWENEKAQRYYREHIWKKVSKIHVHRADSNPVSNYIICSRICQQMQMADLVIVDVSVESANIFYEFGLATAFHKLILPICFSGSYYKMEYPEKLATAIKNAQAKLAEEKPNGKSELDEMPKKLEKHIDCFPWRRKLFEHFGIRRQSYRDLQGPDLGIDDSFEDFQKRYNGVRYLKYNLVTLEQYGFSDVKYNRIPYIEKSDGIPTGQRIYTWLQKSFNISHNDKELNKYNTLIVYTMDRVEDKDQAGLCIINFYNNITKPMREKHCFCGDRVAILGQENHVWDDPKDNQKGQGLPYNVGDLIRLGMDQATYEAENKRIKTEDYLNPPLTPAPSKEQIEIQVKAHIRNRAFQLNPDTPVYVSYLDDGIQKDIPEKVVKAIETLDGKTGGDDRKTNERYFFCLYHVMLDTLRFANEIVVDLSSNSIQSLFWLGAAHGSDIYAVTVRHEMTEQEESWTQDQSIRKDRTILDISGLWTAMFRRDETASFYKQLELIQLGIDQHARLMLPEINLEYFEEETLKQLYRPSPLFKPSNNDQTKKSRMDEIQSFFTEKNRAESRALESYYRDRFWRRMHRSNQLHLFLDLQDNPQKNDPKSMTSKWDLDAIAELTQYLSKRKVISRYQIDSLKTGEYYGKYLHCDASGENFIVIGSAPKPLKLKKRIYNKKECKKCKKRKDYKNRSISKSRSISIAQSLACYLNVHYKLQKSQKVFEYDKCDNRPGTCKKKKSKYEIRSFVNGSETYQVQFLPHNCIFSRCPKRSKCIKKAQKIENSINNIFPENIDNAGDRYLLLAQLLLWREEQTDSIGGYKYHVSLCGASGPATKALTALLVDEEQKWGIWGNTPDGLNMDLKKHLFRYLPLNTLQAHIRKDFCNKLQNSIDTEFIKRCNKKCKDKCLKMCNRQCPATGLCCPMKCWSSNAEWNEREQLKCKDDCKMHTEGCANGSKNGNVCSDETSTRCKDNLEIVKQLSLTYLSTVLPRYFLPFLSLSDEKRIYHGIEAFLRMTGGQDTPIFESAINQHSSIILDTLEKILADFRGVDALYSVSVSVPSNASNTDDRSITDIRLLKKTSKSKDEPVINCLYVTDPPKKDTQK